MSQDKNSKKNINKDLDDKVEDIETKQNTDNIIEDSSKKEEIKKDSKGKIKEEKKKVNFKSYFTKNKGKKILTISLIAIIGLGIGFYIGKDVGRSLPVNHKYYSKSEVLATVDNVKITGDDFRKRMEPYFYLGTYFSS